MRNASHNFGLFPPTLLVHFAVLDELVQRRLHDILLSCRHVPHIRHNPKSALAELFLVENLARAGTRRRRLLPGGEPGALQTSDNERGEQVLGIFRAHAELLHLLDVVRGREVATGHDDLELNKVCDVENGVFALRNAGAYQGPVEIRQSLSRLSIVGDLCSARGAKVSRNRHVRLVVEAEGEMEFADAGYVLEGQVGVPGASAHDTNVGPGAMAEPHHEAIGVLEKPVLLWKHRPLSLMSRDAARFGCVLAGFNKSRLVLGHGRCKSCALETLALMR